MNDNERMLIRHVCEGNLYLAQQYAKIILNGLKSKKDETFKDNMLYTLNTTINPLNLPYNLQHLLIAEDSNNFPESRFLLRKDEKRAVHKILDYYKAAETLSDLGISYLPALILYGESGCGKTMLARYIAYQAKLPFVYVRFSNLIDSHLGKTQNNLSDIFHYVKTAPCVLCFDEIDMIGMKRGQKDDVGEMNRIVISLMQELDRCPNHVIIIATTNRFDRLDSALVRRFPFQYELKPLSFEEAEELSRMFFEHAGLDTNGWFDLWCESTFENSVPASTIIRECTEKVVEHVLQQEGLKEHH